MPTALQDDNRENKKGRGRRVRPRPVMTLRQALSKQAHYNKVTADPLRYHGDGAQRR